jgi:hypothetical protein
MWVFTYVRVGAGKLFDRPLFRSGLSVRMRSIRTVKFEIFKPRSNMDLLTFIDKHATSIIAVLGTLFGVMISQISNWLMKKQEFKNHVKLKRIDFGIEFEKKNLIEPVLLFLESDLKLITAMYQKGLQQEKNINEILGEHILEMSMVSARLRVYGNAALNTKFEEFTRKRLEVGFKALNENMKDMQLAYDKLREAEVLASEIIILLKDKLEKLKT